MPAEPHGVTVAVTGPTGEIGRAFLHALEDAEEVDRVIGMARRPFDPAAEGLTKTEYLQGDVRDRASVERLVEDADVVVHLAFLIFGEGEEARRVNLQGARNVFEASFAAARRLIYTSSVAAYGFHEDNPPLLTEEVPARGTDAHPYSRQKAEVEELLQNLAAASSGTDTYVFRPCIVAGPSAQALIERIPYVRLGEKMPARLRKIIGGIPLLRPVIPDPGIPFQLVHEEDVAQALVLAATGRGAPGIYNLAADGSITFPELARALGWYSVPLPDIALDATMKIVSNIPLLPADAKWVNAIKVPVLMDCTKARTELGWAPRHDALDTLADAIASARSRGVLPWPGAS